MKAIKAVRIFLLILIIIGIGLICTQKIWVPKLVAKILESEETLIVSPVASSTRDNLPAKKDTLRIDASTSSTVVPSTTPMIGKTYPNDLDGDRIEDALMKKAREALAGEDEAQLRSMVNIELIFGEQTTQVQTDEFLALGGKIDYVYKAVSYGWNGRLPLGEVIKLSGAMGDTFLLAQESKTLKFE